jgi:16S rRNA C967 or C1407 C5-methylase (RsmB/RsmF family)/NOL1/NOP2/fmu family ribosome biogenesis protein
MNLPQDFIDLLNTQHPPLSSKIIDGINSEFPTSIRLNKLKLPKNISNNHVPWCQHAEYLESRPSFTLDPLFHGGAYYVQEASSMVLYYVLDFLKISKSSQVLDLCASPGGKSTLILDYLEGNGILIANEVIKSRVIKLEDNIIKWGYNNAVITSNDPKDFKKLESYFDIIFIDAPCSGEGMFRKDPVAIQDWSLDHVEHCALRQQRIFDDIYSSLKKDGYFIYSTCTFNHQENIDNIVKFCTDYKLESIAIDMPKEWVVEHVCKDGKHGYHFFPGMAKGEGFFFSVLKKIDGEEFIKPRLKTHKLLKLAKEDLQNVEVFTQDAHIFMHEASGNVYAYNLPLADNIEYILDNLAVKYSGIRCGTLQKKLFLPEHPLALSFNLSSKVHRIELSKEDALAFLNKTLVTVSTSKTGWMVATYNNLPLGWLKNLGNRINNYFPAELRIRMNINK